MYKIKELREKAGIKQVDLARNLNVGQSAIAMWEAGEAMPRADRLPALAKLLGCTIDDLFCEKGA